MSQTLEFEAGFEPERYELDASPLYNFPLNRRELFTLLGGGLVVLLLTGTALAQVSGGGRRRGGNRSAPQEVSAWLHIGEGGQVTVYTGKAEVGQNIRTSLTQAVAEELRTPPDSIALVMGDTALTPFDMGTFGSRTTPDMAPRLRKAAAAAREMLIDLAAAEWKADRAGLDAENGCIVRKATGDTLAYGKLTKGQKLTKAVAEDAPLTPAAQWKTAGHTLKKVDGRAFVTGKHKYASDMKRPGMQHGKILRPPSFGATLVSLDTKAAEAIPQVTVVHDGDFVGVVAPDEYTASRALNALKAEWKTVSQISSENLTNDFLKQWAAKNGGAPFKAEELVNPETHDVTLKSVYGIPYIAHAPLEPRAAVAEWEGDKLTVWTGTQRPFGVQGELAQIFKIPEANIRVVVPDTGSGYGGKHTGDAAVEAARLARAAGKPVKRVWTREEEFIWAYFRPAGVILVSASARKDGTLMAWEFHNLNSGASGIAMPYEVPDPKTEFHAVNSPLRQGSYRGLAATANHFARERHIDMLADYVKLDPLAFRLKNLKEPRLRAVLEAAAKAFDWGKTLPPNHGAGLACGTEKGGYVATCAEVALDHIGRQVKVVRAVTAFECGAIVNPDQLKNQVEGAVMMGLGGALFEAIRFENGKILNPRFSAYRVPRFSDAPQLETVLLDRKDLPAAGAGETPIVAIAPAIGNAIAKVAHLYTYALPLNDAVSILPSMRRR